MIIYGNPLSFGNGQSTPDTVSNLILTPNKSSATLTWNNPTQSSYFITKIIQKEGSTPENLEDGIEVYSGTDETAVVSGLQDGTTYYFAVFALSKTGRCKNPAVANYTPAIYPKYKYTGNHTLVKDENDHWRVKLLSSGVLEWLSEDAEIDVFLVGGGSGARYGGGAGGYTKTVKKITIEKGQRINVIIGAGGKGGDNTNPVVPNIDGGSTSFGEHSVEGGKRNPSTNNGSYYGNNGGSGGGGSMNTSNGSGKTSGNAGSDGSNGGNSLLPGGTGQGTTTREFGEPGATLYAPGGVGAASQGGNLGAAAQSDEGPTAGTGTSGKDGSITYIGAPGGRGYGSGGGGGVKGGDGTSGIVVIRDSRESA